MSTWTEVAKALPPEGRIVMTKLDNAQGCRNEQALKLRGRLWYFADDGMYVYYCPTHWRELEQIEKASLIKQFELNSRESDRRIRELIAGLNEV